MMNKLSVIPYRRSLQNTLALGLLATGLLACSANKNDEQVETKPEVRHRVIETLEVELVREEAVPMFAQKLASHKTKPYDLLVSRPIGDFRVPNQANEKYQRLAQNGIKQVLQEPISTFSIDVDTGSYSNVRRMLNQGVLPPADAVRLEEFVNYFDYDYQKQPTKSDSLPFSFDTALSTSPWGEQRHLLRIAINGLEPEQTNFSGRNLVFLLDVSGSMAQQNKLPLLTRSLEMLTGQLTKQDSVSIVVYAGASGVVLPTTKGNQGTKIKQALKRLSAGGATNGETGIELAYSMAQQAFIKGGVNRVILATDGDFNLGLTDHNQLIELIKKQRDKGIALTTLGFGQGNYNDHLMEQLADAGNGNYAYIDTIHEARKVLVDEMNATLLTIAKDVKVQIEFNPNVVSEYRLLGYENRHLNAEDFNNDKVDAGEIGAGHTVTAFYELTLKDASNKSIDKLRYQNSAQAESSPFTNEVAMLKLRYKPIDSDISKKIQQGVTLEQLVEFNQQSDDFRFAAGVLGFAHLLKHSHYWQDMDYAGLIDLALSAKGADINGYRAEYINLLRTASELQSHVSQDSPKNLIPLIDLTLPAVASTMQLSVKQTKN